MYRLKKMLILAVGMMLIACTSGNEENVDGNTNNDGSNDSSEKPNIETPIIVEELPDGVEIKKETLQLNNIQLKYIENIDEENSTLTFSTDLPAEQLPQVGQIIL